MLAVQTKLSAAFWSKAISIQHDVHPGTTTSSRGSTSASSCGPYVKSLPRNVVPGVSAILSRQMSLFGLNFNVVILIKKGKEKSK